MASPLSLTSKQRPGGGVPLSESCNSAESDSVPRPSGHSQRAKGRWVHRKRESLANLEEDVNALVLVQGLIDSRPHLATSTPALNAAQVGYHSGLLRSTHITVQIDRSCQ